MKKILGFFAGFLILIMTFAMLYMASIIYDTNDRVVVEPFFLRDGTVSNMSIPKSMSDVENKKLQTWLIKKFVTEYLYVTPNKENIANRQKKGSVLYYLSTPAVFQEWNSKVAPILAEMAKDGVRQTVYVFDEIAQLPNSDYLQVDYELKTWYKPNDMTETPKVTRGTLYINIGKFANNPIELRTPVEKVYKKLLEGIEPAIVFVFNVTSVLEPGK